MYRITHSTARCISHAPPPVSQCAHAHSHHTCLLLLCGALSLQVYVIEVTFSEGSTLYIYRRCVARRW
jgi:hypothetical protein